jgi:hypothetical protein
MTTTTPIEEISNGALIREAAFFYCHGTALNRSDVEFYMLERLPGAQLRVTFVLRLMGRWERTRKLPYDSRQVASEIDRRRRVKAGQA